jgi:plastocyanin
MPRSAKLVCILVGAVVLSLVVMMTGATPTLAEKIHQVVIPEEDRFDPFTLTIRSGDVVEWVNRDTDDHSVVTNFTTAGHKDVNHVLPGTDITGGTPSTFRLRFRHPGTFVYFCRLHAHLDNFHQPVAPGPDGGIQDQNNNFGTPMMGVITVLPSEDD